MLVERAPEVLDCVTIFGDTMLHHILEPVCRGHARDKSEEEASFCLRLVTNMSLPQLCRRNPEGICPLSYAEQFAENTGWTAWEHVRDAIKHRINMLCAEIMSLPELLELEQSMEQAIRSANDYAYDAMDHTVHLEEVVL